MKRIRGLVSILRPEDCTISAAAVWIGWIAASGHLLPSHPLPLIFWSLSTFLLVGALNVLNDLGDVKIDRLIHGKRALASGRISLPLTERYLVMTILGLQIGVLVILIILTLEFTNSKERQHHH